MAGNFSVCLEGALNEMMGFQVRTTFWSEEPRGCGLRRRTSRATVPGPSPTGCRSPRRTIRSTGRRPATTRSSPVPAPPSTATPHRPPTSRTFPTCTTPSQESCPVSSPAAAPSSSTSRRPPQTPPEPPSTSPNPNSGALVIAILLQQYLDSGALLVVIAQ